MNAAKIPTPVNEPVLSYAPGTRERGELKQALKDLSGRQIEIPIVIGGKEIRTKPERARGHVKVRGCGHRKSAPSLWDRTPLAGISEGT